MFGSWQFKECCLGKPIAPPCFCFPGCVPPQCVDKGDTSPLREGDTMPTQTGIQSTGPCSATSAYHYIKSLYHNCKSHASLHNILEHVVFINIHYVRWYMKMILHDNNVPWHRCCCWYKSTRKSIGSRGTMLIVNFSSFFEAYKKSLKDRFSIQSSCLHLQFVIASDRQTIHCVH